MGAGAQSEKSVGEDTSTPPPPSPSSAPLPPINPATAPASSGNGTKEIVPGVDQALFVEFVLATGKMDIPGALAHAQQTSKFKKNASLMDWLMRPGTNIWKQRDEMLTK